VLRVLPNWIGSGLRNGSRLKGLEDGSAADCSFFVIGHSPSGALPVTASFGGRLFCAQNPCTVRNPRLEYDLERQSRWPACAGDVAGLNQVIAVNFGSHHD
jgi:hypothetical protein